MKEKYYPKNLWVVRIDGCNYTVKATQEQLEYLFQKDKITEYEPLVVYKL